MEENFNWRDETVKPSPKTGPISLQAQALASFTQIGTRLKLWHGKFQVSVRFHPNWNLLNYYCCVL